VDVRYINPFIASVTDVFKTMLNTAVTIAKPQIKSLGQPSADVSGIIGYSGDAVGSVVLSFPAQVAMEVASRFCGCPVKLADADFSDAIGELANMVAGGAKSRFEGLKVAISLPNVIIGENHIVSRTKTPQLVIPCQCQLGEFFVEVAMVVPNKPAASPARALVGEAS